MSLTQPKYSLQKVANSNEIPNTTRLPDPLPTRHFCSRETRRRKSGYGTFPIDESQVKNGPEPDGSTNSPATGQGHLEYDSQSKEFKIRIEFEGLAGDLSKLHVHGPSKSNRSTPRHVIEFLGPTRGSCLSRDDPRNL